MRSAMPRRMPRYAKKDLGVSKGGEGVVDGFEGVGIEEGSEAAVMVGEPA